VLELALVPALELEREPVPVPVLELERVPVPVLAQVRVPARGLGLVPHKQQTNHPPMPLPSPKLISVFYSLFSSFLNIGVILS